MANKCFKNGKQYTLGELFSDDIKFIIPDLQRDYCWGNTGKLVSDFTNSLIELFESNDENSNLGLIYGYESAENHIELCDGQQRITTLYLLLGLLNKKSGNNAFASYLQTATDELRLQYAIRESTLFFLEDLAKNFFFTKNNVDCPCDLKKEEWYFKDYDLDPSIQSMLSALETIEQKIHDIDVNLFGEFIVKHIAFLYIDLENRINGEETFVIINTTGEPLSPTENLKPLLITNQPTKNQYNCSRDWEKWEEFFWQYRGKNDTADNGLKEFFRWITLLNLDRKNEAAFIEFKRRHEETGDYAFSTILNIEFDDIREYFKVVEDIFSESLLFGKDVELLSPGSDGNRQIDWFKVLPVIAYCKKFPKHTERDVLRVKQFFSNIARIDNVSKNINDLLPKAIDIIHNLPNSDIISILNEEDVSVQILSDEEKKKFSLYTNENYDREKLENKFWKEEAHPVWNGKILPLITWSTKSDAFDVNLFDAYVDTFNKLFHDDMEYEKLDITRQALLTLNLEEYPKVFRGYTNFSFCYEYSDWQQLINENVKEFGKFIKKLNGKPDVYAEQKKLIDNSSKKYEDKLEHFVKHPELLRYCKQKNIQWDDNLETWWLIHGTRATRYIKLENYLLYLNAKSKYESKDGWETKCWESDGSVTYLQRTDKTVIDLYYEGSNKYTLQLFNRNDSISKIKYKSVAKELDLTWNGERYESSNLAKNKLFSLLDKIIGRLN